MADRGRRGGTGPRRPVLGPGLRARRAAGGQDRDRGARALSGDGPSFAELAAAPAPALDALCLALAGEFGPVDRAGALATLDALGEELAVAVAGAPATPDAQADACAAVLGERHGFAGDSEQYDDPRNSMLDAVLERRRGLPILLSVVYVEVARRAGVALAGVGLPGHFVAGHFGGTEPVLLDPFGGGARIATDAPPNLVRPWAPTEIAMRMLNNLVGSFQRRADLTHALKAARLRLALPADDQLGATLRTELLSMQARLN